jgi:hypothetical protein
MASLPWTPQQEKILEQIVGGHDIWTDAAKAFHQVLEKQIPLAAFRERRSGPALRMHARKLGLRLKPRESKPAAKLSWTQELNELLLKTHREHPGTTPSFKVDMFNREMEMKGSEVRITEDQAISHILAVKNPKSSGDPWSIEEEDELLQLGAQQFLERFPTRSRNAVFTKQTKLLAALSSSESAAAADGGPSSLRAGDQETDLAEMRLENARSDAVGLEDDAELGSARSGETEERFQVAEALLELSTWPQSN